jgi:predicted nucleic-acid-binding Zn-ribbon protein
MNSEGTKCPKCGSENFIDSVRLEECNNCGYTFYYGDAHATGEAQISKELNPGKERADNGNIPPS